MMVLATGRTTGRTVVFTISAADDGAPRAWVLRIHLRPGHCVTKADLRQDRTSGGGEKAAVAHLRPVSATPGATWAFAPFGGAGSRPAPKAGPVAEIRLIPAAHPRKIEVEITDICTAPSFES